MFVSKKIYNVGKEGRVFFALIIFATSLIVSFRDNVFFFR